MPRSTLPPMPPLAIARRHATYNDQLVALVQTQAMHREHATERDGLRLATDELRRWLQEIGWKGPVNR